MDLNTSLAEAQLAVDFFFNNKFGEARQLMEPWSVCLCLYGIFNASVLYSVDRFMLCNSKKKIVQHFTSFIASHLYRSETSMYHSVGNCVFLFLEAVLTFEHEHIVRASEAIKRCLGVCNRHRKKNTITESIGKTFKRVSLLAAFCDIFSALYVFRSHI